MIKNYLKFYKIKTFRYSWRYTVTSNLYYYLTWYSSHNSTKTLNLSTLLFKEKIFENIDSNTYKTPTAAASVEKIFENIDSNTYFKQKYILKNSKENISTYLNFLKRFLKEDNETAEIIYRKIERIHSEINTTITKKKLIKNNTYNNNNKRMSPIGILNKNNNEIEFSTHAIENIWNLNKIEKELTFYSHKMENKKNRKVFGWTMSITIITFVITTFLTIIFNI